MMTVLLIRHAEKPDIARLSRRADLSIGVSIRM
jgi:hypothetical protein